MPLQRREGRDKWVNGRGSFWGHINVVNVDFTFIHSDFRNTFHIPSYYETNERAQYGRNYPTQKHGDLFHINETLTKDLKRREQVSF